MLCLPSGCKWLLTGDWNFMEKPLDKSNCVVSHTLGEEKRIFNALKQRLQVEDKFPSSSPVKFNWDSRRRGLGRILARLDRTYTFKGANKKTTSMDYKILGDSAHSDHLPIWRQVWLVEEPKRNTPYVMSNMYLGDPTTQSKIKEIWQENESLPFFGKIRKCVKFYKELCIRKAKEGREEEVGIRKEYGELVILLQSDPDNLVVQDKFEIAKSRLQQFELRKNEGQRLRNRLNWIQNGDSCSKEFFQAHRQRSTANHITELMDQQGQLHSSKEALARICHEYYQTLYKARDLPHVLEETQTQALSHIVDRLSIDSKTFHSAPITLGELEQAMKAMALGKSPGPDGITLDFYRIYWKLIGMEYWSMIKESIAKGQLPSGVT